jgi:uncharacterized protein (DUF302 family)
MAERNLKMISYGFTKELDISFEKTIKIITEELKKEGFGILTKIDVQEKFKEKLGVEFKKYTILGACNPSNAHKAILAEENIGLMLPCNVIVFESGEKTVISVIKPTVAMEMIKNDELRQLAEKVEAQLKNVFDSIY